MLGLEKRTLRSSNLALLEPWLSTMAMKLLDYKTLGPGPLLSYLPGLKAMKTKHRRWLGDLNWRVVFGGLSITHFYLTINLLISKARLV